jgi:hypothetical protein
MTLPLRLLALLTVALLVPLACFAADTSAKTVRDFGAIGDGVADDTAAVQKAVDSGVGDIVFPKGSYKLTKTVTIELDKVGFTSLVADGTAKIIMSGTGPAFHFVGTHSASADPWNFQPNVWERQRMPLVRGLEIIGYPHPASRESAASVEGAKGLPTPNTEADGIEVTGVMQFTITETIIHEVRHAIHLTTLDRNIIVSACHLYHNSGCGVYYDHVNLHQSNIVGCHISYCAGGGVVTRGGAVRNVQIGTCDIESNMTADAPPTANVLLDSTDGSTDEVAITGCTLQHNDKSPGSANIRVIGQGVTSPKDPTVTQEGHLAIVGNAMSDVRINVHLQHARGVSITGNTFWEGFDHDILVEDSTAVVIGANDFDRNPRYVVNGHWSQDLNGVVFRNCTDCKLNSFLVKGVWKKPAAVSLEKCDRCTITDLSILDCDGIGLSLRDCTRCRVSDCVVRDDREGTEKKATLSLSVENGKENWIKANFFGNGVKVIGDSAVLVGNRE